MGKLFIAMCTLILMDTLDMAAYAGAPSNHLNHATPLLAMQNGTRRARGVAEAEMRQTGVESIAETSAEREIRRDETQRGSAGRDESRAPAETKAEPRQRRNTSQKRDAKRERNHEQ